MRWTALGLTLMLGACASPTPPTPLPDGMTRVAARSAMVLPGVSQPMSLYTHCGLENAVIDFAGSLWDPATLPVARARIGDPFDEGTITLIGIDRAVFVASSGVRIDLVPHHGTKDVMVCY